MAEQDIEPTDPQAEVQGVLHRHPTSIAEALDLDARLGALSGWVTDRKRAVSGWVHDKAEARRVEDGAAPTWRMDQGTVLLTDPDPKPRITNQEAFGRWYVTELLGRDPDETNPDGEYLLRFDDWVARRILASCPSDALLAFVDEHEAGGHLGDAADILAVRIEVDEEWVTDPDILDLLVAGKAHPRNDGKPRVILDATGLSLIDKDSGEVVPGTTVQPATKRSVQMRPSTQTKEAVRRELEQLLGPAQLSD